MTEVDLSGIKNTFFADCSPGKIECPPPPTSTPSCCTKGETIKMLNYDQCYENHQKTQPEVSQCCKNYKKTKPSNPCPPTKSEDSGAGAAVGAGESGKQYKYCLKPTCYRLLVPIDLDTGKPLINPKIKGLGKKLSSNTFHGINSVNDLRSWSLCPEDRRRHYLEQLRLAETDDNFIQGEVEQIHIAPIVEVENIADILQSHGNPPKPPPPASSQASAPPSSQDSSESKASARESTAPEAASSQRPSQSVNPTSRAKEPSESETQKSDITIDKPKLMSLETVVPANTEAQLIVASSEEETKPLDLGTESKPKTEIGGTQDLKSVSEEKPDIQDPSSGEVLKPLSQEEPEIQDPSSGEVLKTLSQEEPEIQDFSSGEVLKPISQEDSDIQGSKSGEVVELPMTEDPTLELNTKTETTEELASTNEIEAIDKTVEEVPDAEPHDIKAGLSLVGPIEAPGPCVAPRNDVQLQNELARIEQDNLPLISIAGDTSSLNKSEIPCEPVAEADSQGQTAATSEAIGPNTATGSANQPCAPEIPCPTCPLWYTHVPVDPCEASADLPPTGPYESCQDPSVAGQSEAIWSNTVTAPAPQPTFPCDAQSPEQVRLVNEIKKLRKERWDLKRRVHMGLGSNELQLEYDSSVRKVSEMSNLVNVLTQEKQAMEIEVKRLEEANMTRGAELEELVNYMEAERADVQERLNFFTRQLQVEISARRTFQCHFNNAVQKLEVHKLLNKQLDAKLNQLNADLQNAKKNWTE